jgi:hypothetical protein
VAVALPRLVHETGARLGDLLGRPGLGVVVHHDDLVDDTRREEAVDDLPDGIALRERHEHDRYVLAVPHRGADPRRIHSAAGRA